MDKKKSFIIVKMLFPVLYESNQKYFTSIPPHTPIRIYFVAS